MITFESFVGLYQKSPVLAVTVVTGVCGLAGIPPTIGFMSRILTFLAVIKNGYYGIVFLAILNITISVYYFLKIITYTYTKSEKEIKKVEIGMPAYIFGILLIILNFYFGAFPNMFIEVSKVAVKVFF